MKKKILAGALLLAMLVSSVLASCSDGDTTDGTKDASSDAPTVTEAPQTEAEAPYPTENDNYAGTPAYTIDGDNIIVDGVAYPNKNNYNCGPLVAVDDLDRELKTAETSKNYVSEGKYVGLFYFLWMGEHGDSGILDMHKILEEGGDAARRSTYPGWGPVGAMHFFAEPLYGYYYSSDKWVMRKHAEELANANVDFLYIDVTNGYPYVENAKALMEVLSEMNSQGWDAPQIVFYTHTNSPDVVSSLYGYIYSRGFCEDTWFKIDGKPLIIAYENQISAPHIKNFFSYRVPQWPNEGAVPSGGWPWMDFTRPQRVFQYNGVNDAISVSIAQHAGTVCFSDSAIYGSNKNWGRSYHDGRNDRSEGAYLHGYNFQEQWDIALEADVPYILVTSWNEWVAQRQSASNSRVVFIDTCDIEFSRDAEMMRGGYFDNYYMQLIDNIRAYKGTAPTLVQDTRKIIDINGSFDQWDDILVTYSDFSGDTVDRKNTSFGKKELTDTSGRNDIVASKVVYDTKYAYFYVETSAEDGENPGAISAFDTESTWMQLFINSDNATTGWYGYDYIINHKASSETKTTLAKSTSDDEFAFETAEELDYKIEGNKMMIRVPLKSLGITDYTKIKFSFKWVDSDDIVDTMEEMYTSGDSAPHGRLNYIFQNYK